MPSEARNYPERLEIVPLERPPRSAISVPGSKSITNRALVLAALSGKGCELHGALQSEDTEVMIDSLRRLGFQVQPDWRFDSIKVGANQSARVIPAEKAELYVANSGTTMRFLAAMVSAGNGRYRLDGTARMRERPIEDLLSALRDLGVNARSENGDGCPPVLIETNGLQSGQVSIRGDTSSQFLSGLLMSALRAKGHVTVRWLGPYVSFPYVQMTFEMMQQFGAQLSEMLHGGNFRRVPPDGQINFLLPAPQDFGVPSYEIEPDASAASYFFAAAAIMNGAVTVSDLTGKNIQGDEYFTSLLKAMGCRVERCSSGTTVLGRAMHGVDEKDMSSFSDLVMTLAAVACFAEGPTTIRNVAHIRHKETDRISALATELRKIGAEVEEYTDGLKILPRPLHGAEIETYNDHRMAMSMALVGLKVPGIVILNPGCVAKTYPGFWEDLERLRS